MSEASVSAPCQTEAPAPLATYDQIMERKTALEAKCALLSASLKQADQLRDQLVAELMAALPFIEDAEDDAGYKPGAVKKRIAAIRAALTAAGAV